jgi:hypothetical protein
MVVSHLGINNKEKSKSKKFFKKLDCYWNRSAARYFSLCCWLLLMSKNRNADFFHLLSTCPGVQCFDFYPLQRYYFKREPVL